MTEDPIPIGELQSLCTDLPPEQTQDILDVIHNQLFLSWISYFYRSCV